MAPRSDWILVIQEIKRIQSILDPEERIQELISFFARKKDPHIAYTLAVECLEEGKNRGDVTLLNQAREHGQYAAEHYPLEQYKEKARTLLRDIEHEISGMPKKEPSPERLVTGKSENTAVIVGCTKTKIWDMDPESPVYVPAQYAYRGQAFAEFMKIKEERLLKGRPLRWLILSAKYGFIEPWHPISNYDVSFDDETTGPISSETLKKQALYQKRWTQGLVLNRFEEILFIGNDRYYDILRDILGTKAKHIATKEIGL